jgi:hypothetical protein
VVRLKGCYASFLHTMAWPFLRLVRPKLRSIRFSYEKAGLTVADEPIPWNAEAILVEALVRCPPGKPPRNGDFQLRTPDRVPRMAVALHSDGEEATVRAVFRLPPIQAPTLASIHYQGGMLGQFLLPFLAASAFFRNVRLQSPTFFARLGKHNVACQTLVEGQCLSLSAAGILVSPTSLLPITDFDLRFEIADTQMGRIESVLLPLAASQLLGKEAALSVVLPSWALAGGKCSGRWFLGDRLLAHSDLRVISPAAFQKSLDVAEGRFLAQGKDGAALFRHHLPAGDDSKGLRPCFLITSREPGIAGVGTFEVRVQFRDPSRRPLVLTHEMLVTDRPTLCAPDLPAVADFQQIRAFELLSKGQPLGALPVSHTPMATFTSEGGFRAAGDVDWTPFTEEELMDRLEKLMESSAEVQNVCSQA